MKTLLIISVSLCFTAGFSQTKSSSRKNFVASENIEIIKAQVKEDSLNGIKSVNTKKIVENNNNNSFQETIDTLSSRKEKRASSKKR